MKIKKTLAIVLVVVTALSLSACGSSKTHMQSLITGSIDSDIKGVVTDVYLKNSGWTKSELDIERKTCRTNLAASMNMVYGVCGEDTATITNQILPHYEKLLQKFEYEVVESVEESNTSATITIKYRPFLLGEKLDEIAYPFYDNLPEQGNMSDTAYATKFNAILFADLIKVLETFVENPVLGEEMTIELSVHNVENGWSLSDNYYDEFVWSIIDMNLEE